MTLNPVAPTRPSAPGAIDPHPSGSGSGTESSTFQELLAGAHDAATDAAARHPHGEASDGADPADAGSSAATRRNRAADHHAPDHRTIDSRDEPDDADHPPVKKQAAADHEALLAALAALAFMTPDAAVAAPDGPVPTEGADASLSVLGDLPLPEVAVADDAAPVEPVIVPELDVTAALALADIPTPALAPADGESPIAPSHTVIPRAPLVTARPAADDSDDDTAPTPPRTAAGPTHGIGAAGDAARTQSPLAPAAGTTPVAGPSAPTAIAVDTSASEATAVATAAPPPPAEQLVSVLSPLRTTPNGTYSLRLELKPVELGRVEMRVEMRDGVLHASIHADHEGSAQLVRSSLGELRNLLAAEGVRTGDLTVSDGALGWNGSEGRDTNPANGGRTSGGNPIASDPVIASTPPTITPTIDSEATSLLDVRV